MNLLLIFLSTLFVDANALYAEGNYAEATLMYEQVVAQQPSAEAYYNLGNAYFKQGELAQSILAYERALRLKPSYKDAQYNLQFAQSRIVDNIEDTQSFFLSNWMRAVRNAFSMQAWM
jgi:tetratricopeptide (TPR) repeat protein